MSDPPARNEKTTKNVPEDSSDSVPQLPPSDDDDTVFLFDTPLAVLYKYPVPAAIAANTPHDECPRISSMLLTQSAMFVVARGRFSVYQLLGQTIAYVRCGSEFAHPILPRTRVWRIARAQYLLPQPVPRKFWRIELPESDTEEIRTLDNLFAKICSFQIVYEDDPAEEQPVTRSHRLRSRQMPQTRVVSESSSEMTSMLVRQYEEIMSTQQQSEAPRIRKSLPSRRTATLEPAVEDPFGFPLNSPPKPFTRATTETSLCVSPSSPLSRSLCTSPISTPGPSSPLFLHDYPSPTLSDIEACSSPKHNHMLNLETCSTGAYTPEFSSSSSTLDNILDDFPDTVGVAQSTNSTALPGLHDTTTPRSLLPVYSLDEQVLAAVAAQRASPFTSQEPVYSVSRCASFTESSTTVVGDELEKDQETVTENHASSLLSFSPEMEPKSVESKRMSLGRMISSAAVAAVAAAAATLYGDATNSGTKQNAPVTKRNNNRLQPDITTTKSSSSPPPSSLTTDWYGEYDRRRSRKSYGPLGVLSTNKQHPNKLCPPLPTRTLSSLGSTQSPASLSTVTVLPPKPRLSRSASTSSLATLGVMAVPVSPGLGVRVFSPGSGSSDGPRSRRNSIDEDRNVARTITMLTPAEKHAAMFGTQDSGLSRYYHRSPLPEESNGTNPMLAMWGSK
ncbi:uncharacterized protein SAPINGB_P004879 [Magnusiomyces paraingens]|uniref:Inheritance of peroxisomes protein 1 n=1 Tax=Magnusiomyces paraingens TaxID=2606893 RepID=A0A5E8C345_9ASCO|nr:uncharacterized protein SAPINGB_P004879 [Saprochaete ingens]VVT56178.1 unnamed protein product [Saprochaete ingens]